MLEKIVSSIRYVEISSAAEFPKIDILTGFSGAKLLRILQYISNLYTGDNSACYLEVGVFQGLSLLSVASHCPSLPCFGIDNFSYTDHGEDNYNLVKERIAKLGLNNVVIIKKDYEDAFMALESDIGDRKIAVYFVDGPHDYRSQLMCLEYAIPFLHDKAVIVVDDSNYNHVRQANRDFLATRSEWKLVFEAYTRRHPENMSNDEYRSAREGWWNGVNVVVRDTEGILSPMLPLIERDRLLFVNEHMIHSARFAEMAPETIDFIQALFYFKLHRLPGKFIRLLSSYLSRRKDYAERYAHMNTYSHMLPALNYNQSVDPRDSGAG